MSSPETSPSRALQVAYLAHLLVPLCIALDEAEFFLFEDTHHQRPMVDAIALSLCVVWLLAGLAAFFLSRDRTRFALRIQKPLISFYTMLFMFALLEGLVRIALPAPTELSLFPAATQWISHPPTWGVTGVADTTRFTTNEIGLRGPSLPHGGKPYKIVTVGGSTTECLVLDDEKEWPHLVMAGLNDRQQNRRVWLANAGVSGHTTVHHLMVLKSLPIFKQVDMVILLIGLNDLQASLAYEGGPSQAQLELDTEEFRKLMVSYGQRAVHLHPVYKRLRVYQFAVRAKTSLLSKTRRPSTGSPMAWLEMWRRRRAAGKIVPLPDLRVGLDEYRQRVQRLFVQCQALQVRCLFLTQPVLWRQGLTSAEEASLWAGYIGPLKPDTPGLGYVSPAELETAINAYNRALLKMCLEKRQECLDLGSKIPKDHAIFYDDDHYTEAGARIVADRLLEYLLATPPFSKQVPSGAN